ncbi:methionine aminopeptidase [endosymbiont of Euscepes postfasciatus]|uniref:type I methionyl aminopeptidase n=1 Tax=endosymbiont of Euscepes postfasciatus TaxID=650377 RepID=UPI000DC6D1C7|nr:type I methionyl aminopeptidase [endosymbiont of Euscepes postfasciatus]BBA84725.1 methionine aminopeptidase [endosymbiont of Euscepes postfasciatus]
MINLKTDLCKMRLVGKIASKILEDIEYYIKPGISTGKIDELCNNFIKNNNAKSATFNYMGYPKNICTSINNVVCHGIPSYKKIIKIGDIINIDISLEKDGFYSDTSKMFIVKKTNSIGRKICDVAKKSLYLAIKIIKPGIKLREIGKTIQKFVEYNGFSVVRDYCGHGIGKKLHEYPQVLHYDSLTQDNIILEPGMCITIEPMINSGSYKTKIMKDGWTVKTKDNSLSAQYEHTIVITEKGFEVTTLRSYENIYF